MKITNPEAIVGKPFVALIDGEKHVIGTVTRAATANGVLMVAVKPTEEDQ